jgi:uncharacterized membrane protein YhhN
VFAGIAVAAAVANWIAVGRGLARVEYVAKPLTMAALVAVGLTLEPADPTRRAWFVAAGVCSLAGDVFLMLPRDRFVAGLSSFLVAHLCYVAGLSRGDASAMSIGAGVVMVTAAVAVAGRPVVTAVRRDHAALLAPVLVYLVVISAMVVAAVAVGPVVATAGAALFYVSDTLIAWHRFVRVLPWAPVAIMVTYHLGQAGLMGSLLTAA